MLSYQHAFHAGNHADLLKHYVLTFVLNSLNRKEKPYTMFDTHSGSGLYDLFDNRIVKTGEAEKGIQGLLGSMADARGGAVGQHTGVEGGLSGGEGDLSNCKKLPESFNFYLNLIKEYTSRNLYPGSPEIERRMCRPQDSLVLSELHPQEIENLKRNMGRPVVGSGKEGERAIGSSSTDSSSKSGPKLKIHHRSGWEMIKALTPPATKRGAVLIDPSYEETQDYIDAAETICAVNKKWSNGIIMLWYPLLAHRESEIARMIESISLSAKNVNKNVEISNLQLEVYDKNDETLPRLYGSGMLVINSPWKLEEEGQQVVKYIRNAISPLFQKE